MNQPFIHALADVREAEIGAGTRIWQFVVVLPLQAKLHQCIAIARLKLQRDADQ